MDQRSAHPACAGYRALSERRHRCRVGADCADDPAAPFWRPRDTDMREVFNAVRYVLRTGCQWRQLPKDFPPRSTVYSYFWEWTRYGVLDRVHHALLVQCREAEGR